MRTIQFAVAGLAVGALASADPKTSEGASADPSALSPFTGLNLADEVTVEVGGRLQNDWTWADGDPAFDDEDGVEFRAARIFATGTIHDLVHYKGDFDFSGGDVDFKDVYLEVKDTPAGSVRVGNFKEPFSLDQQTSSRFTTFNERSVMDSLVPGRSQGIMLHDACERFSWQAGVFREADDFGNNNNGTTASARNGEYAVTGRVTGTAWNENDGERVLHLGAAYSLRQPNEGAQAYGARPEAHLLNSVAGSTAIPSDMVHLGGLELAWVEGPFSLQGEFVHSGIEADAGGMDADYFGYYVEGSYFLTGEHRTYKTAGGRFDRVRPNENVTREGGRGAHQLAVRYSMLDLDDGPTNNDELEDITVGWNWHLNPNTIVKLNYIHSMFDSGALSADADILVLRFQVDF